MEMDRGDEKPEQEAAPLKQAPGKQPAVAVAEVPAPPRLLGRRAFIRGGFWGGLAVSGVASAFGLWNLLWPRRITGFGTTIKVPVDRIPKPGDPPSYYIEGRFYLVNLRPDEGAFKDFGKPGPGGLLALWQKCPHLGCRVPWRSDFNFEGEPGWFRCPCHGSTYTKAGIRVFGPAPRPMDTMALEMDPQGNLLVNTGKITPGGEDNPERVLGAGRAVARLLGRITGRGA